MGNVAKGVFITGALLYLTGCTSHDEYSKNDKSNLAPAVAVQDIPAQDENRYVENKKITIDEIVAAPEKKDKKNGYLHIDLLSAEEDLDEFDENIESTLNMNIPTLKERELFYINPVDPLEPVNKVLHDIAKEALFPPIDFVTEYGYEYLPEDMRICVTNFNYNIGGPERFLSNLLTFKIGNALLEIPRTLINTVFFLGITDIASELGIPKPQDNDFGLVIRKYTGTEGVYIKALVMDTTTNDLAGDALGTLVDIRTYNPIGWGLYALEVLDKNSRYGIQVRKDIKRAAITVDSEYTMQREAYFGIRNKVFYDKEPEPKLTFSLTD